MKKFNKIFMAIFILAISIEIHAQVTSRLRGTQQKREKFYVGILDFSTGQQDSTLVNVFLQVPYNEVQFYKTGSEFTASYSISIAIMDDDQENLISEKLWDEKIVSSNFNETASRKNFNISLKSFTLKPDDYFVRITIDDNNSKNNYVIEREIEVREFSDKLDLSDVMLVANQTRVGKDTKFVPNVSRNIFAGKTGVPFYYEIYSAEKGSGRVIYSITDIKDKVVFKDTTMVELNKGKTSVFYTAMDTTLSLGTYTISIDAKNLSDDESGEITGKFVSRWAGVPSNVTDLDLAVEQLVYIATPSQLDYIEDAPNREEKIKRFSKFWKQRDPNPGNEENQAFDEYYRRIGFANDNFTHYVDGWKTDMGMVYVVLGPPDNIEHHPFDADQKPYQVWQYYSYNSAFTFLDTTGFGDYRLTNPLDFDYVRGRNN